MQMTQSAAELHIKDLAQPSPSAAFNLQRPTSYVQSPTSMYLYLYVYVQPGPQSGALSHSRHLRHNARQKVDTFPFRPT